MSRPPATGESNNSSSQLITNRKLEAMYFYVKDKLTLFQVILCHCVCSICALCWTVAVMTLFLLVTSPLTPSGSSHTWTTLSWMTLCQESMCSTCDPVGRCSSSSIASGSNLAFPVARTRLTTSFLTSPSVSFSWLVVYFFKVLLLIHSGPRVPHVATFSVKHFCCSEKVEG